ncbi:MAG: hypothetical protein AB1505_27560 [Candidatus Latescibacterota bacterium]
MAGLCRGIRCPERGPGSAAVERLWAWLRQRNLNNRFFEQVSQLKQAIRAFFCYTAGQPKRVVSRLGAAGPQA